MLQPKRPDTPLASTTETAPRKTWQEMSQPEKANKLKSLPTNEDRRSFRDSISADGEKRRQDEFSKGAAIRGLSVSDYRSKLKSDSKKPNVSSSEGSSGNSKNNRPAPCKGGFCTGLNSKS